MRRMTLIALSLCGCSLVVDHEVLPRTCQRSAQCAVLNDIEGLPLDALVQWYCPPGAPSARACTRGAVDEDGDRESPIGLVGGTDCDDADSHRGSRQAEIADGIDNDCNGVIDDGVWRVGASTVPPTAPTVLGAASQVPVTLASARRSDGATVIATTSSDNQGQFGAFDGVRLTLETLRYRSVYTADSVTSQAEGFCPIGGSPSDGSCNFGEVSIAEAESGRWFSASVSRVACAAGELRLGWFGETDRFVVLDARSAGVGSNVSTGVDTSPTGRCSGASRAPAASGATRPAVASLGAIAGRLPSALVTWLARDAGAPICGMTTNVEALGVWLARGVDERNRPLSWAMATDAGRPRVLDATSGSGRAAIVALGDAGWLIGHGRPSGAVALQGIPAFAAPGGMLDTTRPVFEVMATMGATVDVVVLAAGAVRGTQRDVGVAWKEGCGPSGSIRFARVRYDLANPAASVATAPVTLAPASADRPVIAYVDGGMRVVGARVGDRAVSVDDDGGWVVAWIDQTPGSTGARAQRVGELDGAPLGAETPVALASLTGASAGVVLGPGGTAGAGALRYIVHDGAMTRWLGGEVGVRRAP